MAKDERSDDEEDEEEVVEEQEKEKVKKQVIPSVELNGETLVGATGRDTESEGLKRRACTACHRELCVQVLSCDKADLGRPPPEI